MKRGAPHEHTAAIVRRDRLVDGAGRLARAFTLVEILIVIVIILILLAIAAGVGSWAMKSGEEALTKVALKNADILLYEVKLTDSNWNLTSTGVTGTRDMVIKARLIASTRQHLASMPKEVFKANSLFDGWGQELEYYPAGTGGAKNAFFRSKGSDGIANNADDIYSYDVVRH